MKSSLLEGLSAITCLAALTMPSRLAAQDKAEADHKHHHYKLIDIGTFGGPQSYLNDGNVRNTSATVLNNRGLLVGAADTAEPDPFCLNEDCFVSHAFRSDISDRTDLGSLVPGRNSVANWISPDGYYGGPTQTIPLLSGSPAIDAGNPSGCTDALGCLLRTDQRGLPRPDTEDKSGCDMGAYERQSD